MKTTRLSPAALLLAALVGVCASAQAAPVETRPASAIGPDTAASALRAPAVLARPATVSPDGATHAQTILSRVNELRAGLGLAPVTRYVELDAVAQAWSEQMASRRSLDHRPDLASAYPAGWSAASENIAMRSGSSGGDVGDLLFEQWLNSPDHYANMTSPEANAVGIGIAYDASTDSWYATQNFAMYADAAAAGLTAVGPTTEAEPVPSADVPHEPRAEATTEGGAEPEASSPTPTTSAEAEPTPTSTTTSPTPSQATTATPAPSRTSPAMAAEATEPTPSDDGINWAPFGSALPLTGAGVIASLVAVGGAIVGFALLMLFRRRAA